MTRRRAILLPAVLLLVAGCFASGAKKDEEDDNLAPTVSAAASVYFVQTGIDVQFSMTASDPDGTIASYHWAFGDGDEAATRDATHAFTGAGTYQVTATAKDNEGASAQDWLTVEVTAGGGGPTVRLDSTTLHGTVNEPCITTVSIVVDGGAAEVIAVGSLAFEHTVQQTGSAVQVDLAVQDTAGNPDTQRIDIGYVGGSP